MSSGTTGRIALTKAKINKLKKEVLNRLQFVTTTMEVEMDSSTVLYIEIETNDCNNYQKLDLLSVDLVRNDKVFDNISERLEVWLQVQIDDLNHEKYREYIDWEYQSEFETLGGRFCDLSYY